MEYLVGSPLDHVPNNQPLCAHNGMPMDTPYRCDIRQQIVYDIRYYLRDAEAKLVI